MRYRDFIPILAVVILAVESIAADAPKRADYVPPPKPVDTGRYMVGMQMCPLWRGEFHWKNIVPYPERKPLLGWYDEGDPEVTDWEIKWCLDHGVSFFMVCWYRAKANVGKQPVQTLYEHWIKQGLFNSRYGSQFKFAIMWTVNGSVAGGVDSERDLMENLMPYWIETFFRKPNYLVIDGCPVLSVFDVKKFVSELGGEAAAKAAIEKMRVACRAAGFKGLTILGQYCWGTPTNPNQQMKDLGIDYSFAYHWPTFARAPYMPPGQKPGTIQVMDGQEKCWQAQSKGALPNITTVSVGWDSTPWKSAYSKAQWRLTPDEFKTLCQRARVFVDQKLSKGLDSRMILIDNWNEYGEGHYIFPNRKYGFGYLDAIRNVFATNATAHKDVTPEDIGRGPYNKLFPDTAVTNLLNINREGAK